MALARTIQGTFAESNESNGQGGGRKYYTQREAESIGDEGVRVFEGLGVSAIERGDLAGERPQYM